MWRGWWAPLLVERGFKQIVCCPVEGDESHMLEALRAGFRGVTLINCERNRDGR